MTRRDFLRDCGLLGVGTLAGANQAFAKPDATARTYHYCITPDALEANPDILNLARHAGVRVVWVTGFLYGYWPYTLDRIGHWRRRIEDHGMEAQVANVPLGHPGDSLGSMSGTVPLTPPRHWRMGVRPDGSQFAGTSLHPPATAENVEALRQLAAAGVKRVFVDDDFRLAQGPGGIGGCFCAEHKQEFLRAIAGSETQWQELLAAVRGRSFTPLLRQWIEYNCDQLSASFRTQQAGARTLQLGIMVMYLGAEKAGIRLKDYRRVPFRVGELMFDDASFAPVKGKTNELFSSLFHRRFAAPALAYSETTAFPAHRLSARNMAAKLAVSTLSDVRHTMFMSGLTTFPSTHWPTLGPAMKHHAQIHRRIVGHTPRGPFKHYWGDPSRYVGDDNPYSLFLALGVPFEVTEAPAKDGYTFLSDADVRVLSDPAWLDARTVPIVRTGAVPIPGRARPVPESLAALFALKRDLVPTLRQVPYVEQEIPVVCAWYPTAKAVLLWNLDEQRRDLTVRYGQARRAVTVDGLAVALIEDLTG